MLDLHIISQEINYHVHMARASGSTLFLQLPSLIHASCEIYTANAVMHIIYVCHTHRWKLGATDNQVCRNPTFPDINLMRRIYPDTIPPLEYMGDINGVVRRRRAPAEKVWSLLQLKVFAAPKQWGGGREPASAESI
jgi:hypothetical protein